MNVTIRQMRAFIAVASDLSFTTAARKMNMTQPALTASVKALENQLGHILLDRGGRTIKLTAAGELFLETASALLQEIDTSLQTAQLNADRLSGYISLSAPTWFLQLIVASALSKLMPTNPELSLNLCSYTTYMAIQGILADELDFAICSQSEPNSAVTIIKLLEDRMGILTAGNYGQGEPVNWENLDRQGYIALSNETGINRLLKMKGILSRSTSRPVCQVANTRIISTLVKAGLGYSIVPAMTARLFANDGLFFTPLDRPSIVRELYLVKRKSRRLSPQSILFLRELQPLIELICNIPDVAIKLTKENLQEFIVG